MYGADTHRGNGQTSTKKAPTTLEEAIKDQLVFFDTSDSGRMVVVGIEWRPGRNEVWGVPIALRDNIESEEARKSVRRYRADAADILINPRLPTGTGAAFVQVTNRKGRVFEEGELRGLTTSNGEKTSVLEASPGDVVTVTPGGRGFDEEVVAFRRIQ
jgi:hypothetical protein